MKKLFCFILISCMSISAQVEKKNDIEKRITEILSKMTLEEKVGQMTQLTLETVAHERKDGFEKLVIDEEKLRNVLVNHYAGSILNTGGFANSIENWHEIITTIQDVATKETRLGIPVLYGIDAIHGANYTKDATLFPQNFGMAASFDRDLIRKSAEVTALEVRASGIPWNFNPVLGLAREPAWPRFWETFGEDVYLASEMGKQYVEGLQGEKLDGPTGVAACAKHYLGYSIPKNGLDRTPAWIPERMLREILLPPFEAAIRAGAPTVMVNSSEINGIPVHSDYNILTKLLKEELGFEGFVVSDWEDIKRLFTRDRVATSPKEAVKMAVMAGLDMSMIPYDLSFYDLLIELVKDGEVPISRIDDAVKRILKVKLQLGLFENPYPNKDLTVQFASESSKQLNMKAARESITLLKNEENVLPLVKDKKIFVTGPASNLMSVLNGGWSLTWQGSEEEYLPKGNNTILEALTVKLGKDKVTYYDTPFGVSVNLDEVINKSGDIETVILCLGESPYCEGVGNIYDLALEDKQIALAEALTDAGKKVILVLVEGRPRLITKIADKVDAILMAYLPGMEGGDAIADILYGDSNPCGKLSFSYPQFPNGNTCYDYKPIEGFEGGTYKPLYPFGYGLSYTSYKYSNLTLSDSFTADDTITITVDVKNTGNRIGKEIVHMYLTDMYGSVSRPEKQLKGFDKIELKPGESKTVSFELNRDDLSFIGRENTRIVEKGEFKISVADLQKTFSLK